MINNKIKSSFKLFIIIFLLTSIFMRPEAIYEGVMLGLNLCYNKLIPSLFPFLLVSGAFMQSSAANYIGFIFSGYLKLLGIKSKKAQAAVLMALLGGFAVCGMLISRLYKNGEISKNQAELLICCAASVSPAFAVSAIGYGLLKSSQSGTLMYTALFIASLICGILLKPFFKNKSLPETQIKQNSLTLAEIIQSAVNAMLSLCGFVVAFCFINAAIVPKNAPNFIKYLSASVLEVTAGCQAALGVNFNKIFLCCGAMSLLGLCAVLQMQSFCGKEISLMPFILSRVLHLPLSLAILYCLLKIFPVSVAASVGFRPAYRLPADTCVAFFILLIAFFFDFSSLCGLRNKKFKV